MSTKNAIYATVENVRSGHKSLLYVIPKYFSPTVYRSNFEHAILPKSRLHLEINGTDY